MRKYNVYFSNYKGEERIIGTADEEVDRIDSKAIIDNGFPGCMKIINDFLAKNSYKSYYKNIHICIDGRVCVDVGSHCEFFYIGETYKPKRFYGCAERECE